MARIQERIAAADINLREAYASDPPKYAPASRRLAAEAYEICDKLSLVQPLSWNLRTSALCPFGLADYQAEDGLRPDLDLILRPSGSGRGSSAEPRPTRARANLASSGDDSPRSWPTAAGATRRPLVPPSLDTARGDPDSSTRWPSITPERGTGGQYPPG